MKVTRKVASRKLKRKCIECDEGFKKGDVYYLHRHVFAEDGKVYAYEHLICARCTYKEQRHSERFKDFQNKCKHPEDFIEESYCYIPGESVMEPDYDRCLLCSQIV